MTDERLRGPCEKHGLAMPERALLPGEKCRLDDIERPGEEDGYLSLFADGAGGFIQNWRRQDKGEVFFFDGRRPADMTEEEKRAARQARKAAKELERSKHRLAAMACAQIWKSAGPASALHPYLVKKRCTWLAGSLRQLEGPPMELANWRKMRGQVIFPLLVIPGYDQDGNIQALEYIDADLDATAKLFHPGAKQEGAYFSIGTLAGARQAMLAEGISTAASLFEAMSEPDKQIPAVVAFSAGNLPTVAKWLALKLPDAAICVCADDDNDHRVDSQGRPVPNKGLLKGHEAAAAIAGYMATPGAPGADFNDIYLAQGAAAVRARLAAAEMPRGKPKEATPAPDMQDVLKAKAVSAGERVTIDQCWGVLDQGKIIHLPSGKFMSMSVIDKAIHRTEINHGGVIISSRYSKASDALMAERAVSSAVWAPGEDLIIVDKRLKDDVAWVDELGARQLNLYRPPLRMVGDARLAAPWLDHIRRLWPDEWEHLLRWFAHRRQRPHQKINHALVLGGAQGCGKDTALEPLKYAVGAWNFREVSPREIVHNQFNPYIKSIVMRVSEARDMGETDRYKFYETMKTLCASPPDVLMMNDKHDKSIAVLNVTGIIYTTNHKVHGMHLAADDRRHFVAWTSVTKEEFEPDYFSNLYAWMTFDGGMAHAAAYLDELDISRWDCKAPPPKTNAFWEMVLADAPQEGGDMADVLRQMGDPDAVTLAGIGAAASAMGEAKRDFYEWGWGKDAKKHRRALVHRLEEAGYSVTPNDLQTDGRWRVGGNNMHIYTRRRMTGRERHAAAQAFQSRPPAVGNIVSIFGGQST